MKRPWVVIEPLAFGVAVVIVAVAMMVLGATLGGFPR